METITASDGVAIAWFSWEGAGPPVVLTHGFVSSTRGNWVDTGVVDALRETGRWVVGIDARGHGHSDHPHEQACYGEARMASDVREVVDALDVEQYDLVGFSMGSIVALLAAVEDVRVRRLVLGGVGAGVVERGGPDSSVISGEELVEALETDDPASLPIHVTGFRRMADASGSDRQALAAHARMRHDAPIPLERVTADTLVIAGADDPLAERPDVLVAALPSARLALVRGDHPGSLKDPRFTRALREFLTREP